MYHFFFFLLVDKQQYRRAKETDRNQQKKNKLHEKKNKEQIIHNNNIKSREVSFFISVVLLENSLKTVPIKKKFRQREQLNMYVDENKTKDSYPHINA
jgi:hypothetical protein